MNYAGILYNDIANGLGIRTSLFVSGCTHHCEGCFNQDYWERNYGKEFTDDVIDNIILSIVPKHINGLSILGGEPMEEYNHDGVYKLCKKFRDKFGDSKNIWLYSGYIFGDLMNSDILPMIDILVDGPFLQSEKDLTLKFRGSKNQRILDVKESLKQNNPVEAVL